MNPINRNHRRSLAVLLLSALLLGSAAGCGKEKPVGETETAAETAVETAAETADDPSAETADETTAAPEETGEAEKDPYTFTEDELYDKLLGGWIGQMVGVTWGASTEFGYCGRIIPEKEMPEWKSLMINDAFGQDDIYVEIPFLDAMKENGWDCDPSYMAEKFRDSQFPLWHANKAGRDNLRAGIPYPDSGSYLYNVHADDLDWQIECDFLGVMYPGMVSASAARAFEIGHIMNYGDGAYGGAFITAMHASAFTAGSIEQIVRDGTAVIPEGTKFRDLMDDVLKAYEEGKTWEENWQMLEDKWAATDKCAELQGVGNIDAKLNSAYVALGLLYGNGDMADTCILSCRCGQDSDCNPSSAASILGNFVGASGIDSQYTCKLDYSGRKFSNTNYTLDEILALNFDLMKDILAAHALKNDDGTWTVPKETEPTVLPFEQWPDELSAYFTAENTGGYGVRINVSAMEFGEKIESVSLDMGDGLTLAAQPALYTYEKPGEYTITCTVKGTKGTERILTQKVRIEDTMTVPGHAICDVTSPTGGGNKDMSILYDGNAPAAGTDNSALQYDTYTGGAKKDSTYAGVAFDGSAVLTGVKFTEGGSFWDGGWFEKTPEVEVLVNGLWEKAEATIDPAYPEENTQEAHGLAFETYTFTLTEPVTCDGVRITGDPGGQAHFISVGEITPVATEFAGSSADGDAEADRPILIASVTSPTGGGSKDISVICDGVTPRATAANDGMQYDTYTGETNGAEAYIGYLYRTERTVSGLTFTEGNHFNNGGWFADGSLGVQVLTESGWTNVNCTISPAYPVGDTQGTFGVGYDTYELTFSGAVNCTGVRLIGTAGGSAGFISVSELTVH